MRQFVLVSLFLSTCCVLSNHNALAQCTASGPRSSATGGNNTSVGTLTWSGTGNTQALDNSFATAAPLLSLLGSTTTNYLTVTNLGFSIPNNYTICGVAVSVYRQYTAVLSIVGGAADNSVRLIQGGTMKGNDYAQTSTAWPFAATGVANYGGATDLWGDALLYSDVNNSNFGVAISANVITALVGLIPTAAIDQITVTVYSQPPVDLPITLQSFTAVGGPAGNVLKWTASADDVANRFIVERSTDGQNWQGLDTVLAATAEEQYSYTDANPAPGVNYYRLLLLNTNGTVGYSQIAAISSQASTTVRCYPNPFHDMISISSPHSFSKVSLKDIQGHTLWTADFGSGANTAQIPASSLPAGLYLVQVDGAVYKLLKN
jgi:Secretion system C-terminal sorting domain